MKRIRVFNLKLQTKLLLLYFLTIFIPLVFTGQIILSVSGNKIIEQTTNITQEGSQQTAINIQILLNQYVDIVNRLSYDQTLNNYLDPNRVYRNELESIDAYSLYLKPVTFYDFNYKVTFAKLRIYFLNTTLLQDLETFIYADKDVQNLKVYKEAVAGSGDLVWGRDNKAIYLARSMYNIHGELEAVVSIEISDSSLNLLINERSKSESMIFIADTFGNVIATNNAENNEGTISGKSFFRPDADHPFVIEDIETRESYQVLVNAIGNGDYYPNWRLFTLIPLDQLINDEQKIRNQGLLVISIGLLVSCGIFMLTLRRITSRIKVLVKKMQVVKTGNLSKMEDNGSSDEIGALTKNFNVMIENLQKSHFENYEVNLKLKDITIKKQEAELYALQNQINPHFLFNTLESIRMGLHNKGDAEMSVIVLNLSKLLRNLLNWQGEFIPLREEMELVNKYLSIQRYRFQDKLEYVTELPKDLEHAYIPKLTIQPVVENAVKHGIEGISKGGLISVVVKSDREGSMEILIEDNGNGIPHETLQQIQDELSTQTIKKSGSIGLKNVHDRLILHFGAAYGIQIESDQDGTRVRIRLPVFHNIKNRIGG